MTTTTPQTRCTHPVVTFVGAGPGAEDLITVRGLRALQNAHTVLYAGSLVHPVHLKACPNECEQYNTASMHLDEQVHIMVTAAKAGKNVVRLHTGDPAMYGAINEQIKGLAAHGVGAHIVPGVSSVFAAAAALGTELTCPDVSQSVVLTRTAGRTPMPEKEQVGTFAKTGATLVFFLSAGKIHALMQELMQEGDVSPHTPAALVYRVSWPDERIILATVADLAHKCEEAGIGRQALILVGEALRQQHTASLLYDSAFSHGYRNTLASEAFDGACALYAFTHAGLERAVDIADGLGSPASIYTTYAHNAYDAHADSMQKRGNAPRDIRIHNIAPHNFDKNLQQQWHNFAAHIFVSATGIAVRKIAPLLQHKSLDPAVVACSESGAHCISLTSGHLGGANRLSRRIARISGGQAVISTATDEKNLLAFDELAARHKARIVHTEAIKALNMALLHGDPISFYGSRTLYDAHYADIAHVHFAESIDSIETPYAVCWCDAYKEHNVPAAAKNIQVLDTLKTLHKTVTCLHISSKAFVVGMGCRRHIDADVFEAEVRAFLEKHALTPAHIACFATCDVKADEQAMHALSKKWRIPLEYHAASVLDTVPVPNPSPIVHEKIGTASVCEAAALLSAGYGSTTIPSLYVQKTSCTSMTLAVAKMGHGSGYGACSSKKSANQKKVVVVGLGSGSARHITPEVDEALRQCDVIAGYTKYVDFIRHRIAGKPLIQNGMMGEVERCTESLAEAAKGKSVCMVCSGDPGILAMAGLLFELKKRHEAFKDVNIQVLPGITAANIAAASLGAPLQNGFSLVSLSDLLVPAHEVRQNIRAVAQSALPVTLYNPAGKKRRALLAEALAIFKECRGQNVLCAYVRHAGRPQEEQWIGTLGDFPEKDVDMSTLVIIGSERTVYMDGRLYEARGYADKYLHDSA